MSFQKYANYKETGLEWLPTIPTSWEIKRLKRFCSVFPSNVDKKSVDGETFVKLCNYTDVYYSDSILEEMAFMHATASEEQIKKFTLRAGDTIITKDSETADDIAIAAFVPKDLPGVICGYHLSMVRPRDGANGAYVKRIFDSSYAKALFAVRANGLTRVGLSQYAIDNIELPLPSIHDQLAIVAFLDHETVKIDALIAEQQRLIELLQEKRQAVISHAVTKGLNPNVPMKDSGVEWLGEVPKHWKVKPLKHLMTLTSGGTPSKENYAYWDGTIPWASSKDLKVDELLDTQDHISRKALDDGAAVLVPAGSILTVVRGMILLHAFPVIVTLVPMAINQDLKAIMPSNGIASGYLAWLLRGASHEVLARVDEAGHGTKVLRMDSWLAMQVPVPPAFEQELIAAELVKRLREIFALTDQAHKAVCLLQERRSALLSAAVTGQIDVRGYTLEAAVV